LRCWDTAKVLRKNHFFYMIEGMKKGGGCMQRILSRNAEDTQRAGYALAKEFTGGETVALIGDLGAGKTVFVKGMAQALGITQMVVSPTFTILREYHGRLPLYHFDVYRVLSEEEMFEVGLEEYLASGGVSVIEWADNIPGLLPEDTLFVRIRRLEGEEREIVIEKGAEV
jgi:tRNA threonylcarbamoyladenosine biosynthesis protein TsaE